MSNYVRQRAALALAIGTLVIGSILTWSSYLDSSSPPYTDSDHEEFIFDQEWALKNIFNRYIDFIESREPEAARLFYKEYGERSKSQIRGRLSKLLMGYLDKYGNVHGYEVTSIGQLSITSEVSERKRLVVFNCEWLKTGYHFTREDCRSDADELVATHPLKRLIEEESQIVREKMEERWLLDKELASIKATHHFLWTLTASLLLFVSIGLVKRLLIFKRGRTSTDE